MTPLSLRYFVEPQRVRVALEPVRKASSFAARVVSTVDYSDCSQKNRLKIETDHRVSKIAEEAVRCVFLAYTKNVSEPDYRVYDGSGKSWASDLMVDGIALAIKCQTRSARRKYGLSWTFQSSKTRRDPILDKPEAWVCFVELNDEKADLNECLVLPPFQIKELMFEEPRLAHLKGNKKVIYAARLKSLIMAMRQTSG